MKVLYIHHNGVYGGASKSLFELIQSFPQGSISPFLVTPTGKITKFIEPLNIPTITMLGSSIFDNTKLSYYRGMRWIVLLREFLYLPSNIISIFKAYHRWKEIDIIHVNEYIPLVSIFLAKYLFKKPIVVHARSVQEYEQTFKRIKFYKWFMEKYVDQIIAIDNDVLQSLPSKKNVSVIYNGLIINNIKKVKNTNNKFRVVIIGNLLRYKGIFEFIEAAKILKDENLDIEFFIVGANIRKQSIKNKVLSFLGFSEDIYNQIQEYIKINKLNNILFTGFIEDIRDFLPTIDINCFPSHLEAVGRSVLESAFYGVPSIVAISKPSNDTIIDGQTGLCIKPYSSIELANAIKKLYFDKELLKVLGQGANTLANKNFNIETNALKVLNIYKKLKENNNEYI